MSEIKRNCNTCKFGLFGVCETLKNNKEYQSINNTNFLLQYEFKENFICDNYKNIYIEYPIEVSKINQDIESEDDLKHVSNAEIDNVWYVKALKELRK